VKMTTMRKSHLPGDSFDVYRTFSAAETMTTEIDYSMDLGAYVFRPSIC
jgi:hypothetical protein